MIALLTQAVLEIPKMPRPPVLVCAYGPTLPSCQQNSELRELFHESLAQTLARFPLLSLCVVMCAKYQSNRAYHRLVGVCTSQCLISRWLGMADREDL